MSEVSVSNTRHPVHLNTVVRWLSRPGRLPLLVGTCGILAFFLLGFVYPLPYNPIQPDAGAILLPPNGHHWFGTDGNGLDVFSRTVSAARRDLPLAISGSLLSLALGVPLGLIVSGRGRLSDLAMRALDVFQAFPLVILAIAIVTLTGNHLINVVFAIMLINVPRFMRLIRSEILSIRELRYVEAARASGAAPLRILFRHILPNVWHIALVQLSLGAANAIAVIAALSFLGVGVSPPEPSWGSMVQDGARSLTTGNWWLVLFPGGAIFIAIVLLNLIADGLGSDRSN